MTQADKRIEWKTRYDAWKASGLSAAEWCRQQGIKDHQMYYWIHKIEDHMESFEKQPSETQWLSVQVDDPVNTTPEGPIFIHFGPISVEVRPGTNIGLLSDIVRVLQNQC